MPTIPTLWLPVLLCVFFLGAVGGTCASLLWRQRSPLAPMRKGRGDVDDAFTASRFRDRRFPLHIPIVATHDGREFHCKSFNASRTGLGLLGVRRVSPGQMLQLTFKLPEDRRQVTVWAEVRWSDSVERIGVILNHGEPIAELVDWIAGHERTESSDFLAKDA